MPASTATNVDLPGPAGEGGPEPSGLRVGIVADDFTSAMDGAGPFINHCVIDQARVMVGERQQWGDARLVAIDVDSRGRGVTEASRLVARAVSRVRDAPVLLKTVDSTLRGHVRAELEAAWLESGRRRVVFAPAFPARGRTTFEGVQFVDGIELTNTSFGVDSRHPICSAAIESILAPLPYALWPGGHKPMPDSSLIVADAARDDDLDRLVELIEAPEDVLWVGSPGLAAALARRHAVCGRLRPSEAGPVSRLAVIVGSAHPINEMQLARLRAALGRRACSVDESNRPGDCNVAVLAGVPPSRGVSDEDAARHRATLARQARALVRAGFDGLIISGGETARAVVSSLGEPEITVLGELASGVVAASLGTAPPVTLVTKAGGFGGPDALVELCRCLTSEVA